MSITYRKLTEKDLETFISMRITQLREEGATEDLDLRPSLVDYYRRHMADGTFVSWLALDGDRIVGTSGMSFVEKPPYFSCPSGRIGLLSSMYTDPAYRRRGIAKELLSRQAIRKAVRSGAQEFLLFTDEETGMTGANCLKPGVLKGDILINLDSEEEGEL